MRGSWHPPQTRDLRHRSENHPGEDDEGSKWARKRKMTQETFSGQLRAGKLGGRLGSGLRFTEAHLKEMSFYWGQHDGGHLQGIWGTHATENCHVVSRPAQHGLMMGHETGDADGVSTRDRSQAEQDQGTQPGRWSPDSGQRMAFLDFIQGSKTLLFQQNPAITCLKAVCH